MIYSGTLMTCTAPINYDMLKTCQFNCKYCNESLRRPHRNEGFYTSFIEFKEFIDGARTILTNWCDWRHPIHIGNKSDPCQDASAKQLLQSLSYASMHDYPLIISTKNPSMLTIPSYLAQLSNVVVQVSMIANAYDQYESIPFKDRLCHLRTLAKHCKRLLIRLQPLRLRTVEAACKHFPYYQDTGVYGVMVEGIRGKKALSILGDDITYDAFCYVKEMAHRNGLVCLSADNRWRWYGDSLECCGTEGLGWRVNRVNIYEKRIEFTERMKSLGTAGGFSELRGKHRDWSYERAYKYIYNQQYKVIMSKYNIESD